MTFKPTTCESFAGEDLDMIASQFNLPSGVDLSDGELIYAKYDGGGYDGEAEVVFFQHGQYWVVYGSHCSCFGLEECDWAPQVVNSSGRLSRVSSAAAECIERHKKGRN